MVEASLFCLVVCGIIPVKGGDTVTVHELEKKLSDATELFRNEYQLLFEEDSEQPATIGDLHNLGAQTFYAIDAMREVIIKFLSQR